MRRLGLGEVSCMLYLFARSCVTGVVILEMGPIENPLFLIPQPGTPQNGAFMLDA